MSCFYTALQTKSQAFLLERRLRGEGVPCELVFMPREIMRDLCSMGVKFDESVFSSAIQVIKRSGLPGCRVYKEFLAPRGGQYVEMLL